jgi:hypothetical protein
MAQEGFQVEGLDVVSAKCDGQRKEYASKG